MSLSYNLKIANMTFRVTSLFRSTALYCRMFLSEERGEHEIVLTQAHIDSEREHYLEQNGDVDPDAASAPDSFYESVALLRVLADYITMHNRVLMHGSSICVNGKGYIFTAVSGTGKSTHTALLRDLHGENAVMINDDKPFLTVEDDQILVCGSI